MKIEFDIPGQPKAKQRPRLGKYNTYTPVQTVNYENWVKTCFIQKYFRFVPLEKQLRVLITAYFEIPKSKSKKVKEQMYNGTIRPTVKPDCDNIAKIVLDSLNKLTYEDDKQVVSLTIEKYYSNTPRVVVEITEV